MTATLLAVSRMADGWTLFFFAAAFILFVIAAVIAARPLTWATFVAAGLACVAFVWAWNALAAT